MQLGGAAKAQAEHDKLVAEKKLGVFPSPDAVVAAVKAALPAG